MKKLIITFSFLLLCVAAHTQISVGISAAKDTLTIGEKATINIKINNPQNSDITALDFAPYFEIENLAYEQDTIFFDKLMDVSIIDPGPFDISDTKLITNKNDYDAGSLPLTGNIIIAVYNIGAMRMPAPEVSQSTQSNIVDLQKPIVFVLPPGGMMAQDSLALAPIKSIIEESRKWTDYLIYLYAILGLGLLYFLIKYLTRPKEKVEVVHEEKVPVKEPAHVIALRDLDQLKAKELWQTGKTKAYHTELTRIMRQYLEDRYEMPALEMTTTQIRQQLNEYKIAPDTSLTIVDILQIADKVKFAKGDAGPEINNAFMNHAYDVINKTKLTNHQIQEIE